MRYGRRQQRRDREITERNAFDASWLQDPHRHYSGADKTSEPVGRKQGDGHQAKREIVVSLSIGEERSDLRWQPGPIQRLQTGVARLLEERAGAAERPNADGVAHLGR